MKVMVQMCLFSHSGKRVGRVSGVSEYVLTRFFEAYDLWRWVSETLFLTELHDNVMR